ncbi:hypothetical protein OH76DRAFT_220829 [Lentinus brumalis]|uniref:Uncharacterized protein n=1 Tax=Lentinus brumalis TaxID=2498619 RepID=A0A371CM49_9APHY|nr:hypothetical protein OH76DRAFT_220829 [Polyporus brumalis]
MRMPAVCRCPRYAEESRPTQEAVRPGTERPRARLQCEYLRLSPYLACSCTSPSPYESAPTTLGRRSSSLARCGLDVSSNQRMTSTGASETTPKQASSSSSSPSPPSLTGVFCLSVVCLIYHRLALRSLSAGLHLKRPSHRDSSINTRSDGSSLVLAVYTLREAFVATTASCL